MNNKSIQYKKKISRPNGCIAGDDDKQQLHFYLVPTLTTQRWLLRSTSKEMQKGVGVEEEDGCCANPDPIYP